MSESVTNPASDANTATKSTPESNPTQQASQQAGHVADAAASGTESTATSTTPGGNQKEKASHEAAGASPEAARGNEPKHLEQPDPNSQAGKIRYSFYEEGGLGIVSFFAKNAVIDKVRRIQVVDECLLEWFVRWKALNPEHECEPNSMSFH